MAFRQCGTSEFCEDAENQTRFTFANSCVQVQVFAITATCTGNHWRSYFLGLGSIATLDPVPGGWGQEKNQATRIAVMMASELHMLMLM
jgi:hypothetical protein